MELAGGIRGGHGTDLLPFRKRRKKSGEWHSFAGLHRLPITRRMEVAGIECMFSHYRSLISSTANADDNLLFLYLLFLYPVPQTHFPRSKRRRGGYLQAETFPDRFGVQAGLRASG
jgi:hypothetical protein